MGVYLYIYETIYTYIYICIHTYRNARVCPSSGLDRRIQLQQELGILRGGGGLITCRVKNVIKILPTVFLDVFDSEGCTIDLLGCDTVCQGDTLLRNESM